MVIMNNSLYITMTSNLLNAKSLAIFNERKVTCGSSFHEEKKIEKYICIPCKVRSYKYRYIIYLYFIYFFKKIREHADCIFCIIPYFQNAVFIILNNQEKQYL